MSQNLMRELNKIGYNEPPKKVNTVDIYLMIKDKDISWIDDLANDPDLVPKKRKARH